ncbi:hypothetical protein SAMN05192553_102856 [Cyclobacterium xiamenense]|uniref:Uncharacterized protein n=2 Tax=Cyclobacterium xiamenense TaxID=1297121 RepID=A0A1H6X357_9BACT|nr:hypothetical protein SAMN05192553_102856 [Cyclobacterium xiamenense]
MRAMFSLSPFNQDISNWCVELMTSEEQYADFASSFVLAPENTPQWGTCPD